MTAQDSIEGSDGLRGEIAIVTGGSKGIGLAIARTFAAHGALVALIARSASHLNEAVGSIEQSGGQARAFPADVTDSVAMSRVVADIERTLGPVSILVNNAGALGPIGPLADVEHEDWWRSVEVNLRGPALCMHLMLPRMFARQRGRVINIVSGAGAMSFTYFSAYVAGKTALVRLTECAATEARPYGVSIFAMEPGTVATSMSDTSVTSADGKRWIPWFRRIFDEGLSSPPERAARRALELASGRGDALTGRYIPLDDDLGRLAASAQQIENEMLYSLRMRRLPTPSGTPRPSAALASIRTEGEGAARGVLRLRRTFRASRESVFTLWTDPHAVASWFLPPGSNAQWERPPEIDARPGGRFSLDVRGDDGTRYHQFGQYRTVEAPAAIALDWHWATSSPVLDAGGPSLVTVEIVNVADGTEVIITHEGLPSPKVRDMYIRGWARCLRGMEGAVGS